MKYDQTFEKNILHSAWYQFSKKVFLEMFFKHCNMLTRKFKNICAAKSELSSCN